MSNMPPPPPKPQLGGDLLRRRALAGGAGTPASAPPAPAHRFHGDASQQQADVALWDPSLPLPLPWTAYFDRQERVHCPDRQADFNVYVAGNEGPVVVCLHGGGYTGASWALIAKALKDKHRVIAPDLRCHGLTQAADETDFSAATLAADVVAIWHAMFGSSGSVHSSSTNNSEGGRTSGGGSSGTGGGSGGVVSPASGGGQLPVPDRQQQQQQQQQQQEAARVLPPTVLVGHSMGGAIAVHAAASGGIASLAGVVVIDVVEGTALASLPYMSSVLQKRPQRFASLEQAVGWAMDSGMCKRQESAHISLPSMLTWQPAGKIWPAESPRMAAGGLETLKEEEGEEEEESDEAQESVDGGMQAQTGIPAQLPAPAAQGQGAGTAGAAGAAVNISSSSEDGVSSGGCGGGEGSEGSGGGGGSGIGSKGTGSGRGSGGGTWVWRTRLEESAPFWEGWYTGLSELFLHLKVPKVLVLVGTDRLDRSLTIGQMQGKFQPVLLPQAGHAVHEDEPERTADAIATFIRRFRIGEPPLQIPRPASGMHPVLPVAIGPAFTPVQGAIPLAQQQQQQ